jgi:hypothetical protein
MEQYTLRFMVLDDYLDNKPLNKVRSIKINRLISALKHNSRTSHITFYTLTSIKLNGLELWQWDHNTGKCTRIRDFDWRY